MEPGHEDREYEQVHHLFRGGLEASMEPGHEDREYPDMLIDALERITEPQWSPVMKTGNTRRVRRENPARLLPQWSPVMKTGNTS